MFSSEDRMYMERALALAAKGAGKTSPNPMVGAVLVKNGVVVGEGYHKRVGLAHAEINAITAAGDKARKATLYVTLEPCNHTGRTAPCTEAIIRAGIATVIFAVFDPNRQVRGGGAASLRRHGITVRTGLLSSQSKLQNEAYFTWHRTGRPMIMLKLAQSLDGRLATRSGDSKWITSLASRREGHRLRAQVDAVMVGAETVRLDDPSLTVRHVRGKNPFRIIVTSSGRLPATARVFTENSDNRTIIAAPKEAIARLHSLRLADSLIFWELPTRRGQIDPARLVDAAGKFGLQSILIEGGASLATSFLRRKLVDKLYQFTAPLVIGSTGKSIGDLHIDTIRRSLSIRNVSYTRVSNDTLLTGYPDWNQTCLPD